MSPRILFIGGSLNQTTQMHKVAQHLSGYEHAYTPFYVDGFLERCRRAHLLEFTILGYKLRQRCLDYLEHHGLPIDPHGAAGGYDLVVTCTDLIIPQNIKGSRIVVVQEGILDPPSLGLTLRRRFPWLPIWIAGTALTGLSGAYDRFCVASEGYRARTIAAARRRTGSASKSRRRRPSAPVIMARRAAAYWRWISCVSRPAKIA